MGPTGRKSRGDKEGWSAQVRVRPVVGLGSQVEADVVAVDPVTTLDVRLPTHGTFTVVRGG